MRRFVRLALALALLAALLAALLPAGSAAAAAKGKAKPKTPAADKPAEPKPAAEKVEGLFSLAGAAGLPVYLKCDQKALADPRGIHGGEVRTVDTDFFRRDFTLDVVFEFPPADDERFGGVVGIGENDKDGGAVVNAVLASLNNPGSPVDKGMAQIAFHRRAERELIGKYGKERGPHLLRMEKKGKTLSFGLSVKFDGTTYKPDFYKTIPDLEETAPYLNRLNSGLFFGAHCTFKAVRLVADGKVVDPSPPPAPGSPAVAASRPAAPAGLLEGATGFVPIVAGRGLPGYWAPNDKAAVGADGLDLKGVTLVTRDSDYFTKDFTLDVVYHFQPDQQGAMVVGLGENGRDSGNWVKNSYVAKVHGPGGRWSAGDACTTFYSFADLHTFGHLGKEHPGPNLLRMQKRGDTLSFALCVGFKDKFEPDFVCVAPSLKSQAPYLNAKNTSLFMCEGGTVEQMRLVVDGKLYNPASDPARPPAVAVNNPGGTNNPGGNRPGKNAVSNPGSAKPGAGGQTKPPRTPAGGEPPVAVAPPAAVGGPVAVGPMFSLAGSAGLPAYLKCNQKVLGDGTGLIGGEVRTVDADFLGKDFTFDVLADFPADAEDHRGEDDSSPVVGIGENARDGGWTVNSLKLHVPRPENANRGGGRDGQVELVRHRTHETIKLAPMNYASGPNLFRLQKAGGSLTFSFGPYANGSFAPVAVRSIPDLAAGAPFLTSANSGLFFGGRMRFRAVRLEVAGKPVPDGKPAVTVAAPADVVGPEGLVKLTDGRSIPRFLVAMPKLAGSAEGIPLKEVTLRTRTGDYLTKDFTFDVVYHIARGSNDSMLVGLGENKRDGGANWAKNSVMTRMHAAGNRWADGAGMFTFESFAQMRTWAPLGTDRGAGTTLLRMQKRGDTLTFAAMANYKDKFAPDYVAVVPSLKSQAPTITDKNGFLFVGEAGVIEKVRLVVGGETAEGMDVALDVPPRAAEGTPLRAQLVKAAGARQLSAIDAPKGLALTPAGLLTWTPAADQVGRHEFKVKIADGPRSYAKTVSIAVYPRADAAAVGGDLAKAEGLYRSAVLADKPKLVPGLNGASLLALSGSQLRRLGPDGFTAKQTYALPRAYDWVGERDAYFVLMSNEGKCLDLVDKQTLKVTRSVQMDYNARFDLALHPNRPVSYVSVRRPVGEKLTSTVLVVNEANGEVLEPERCFGTYLKVSPDGQLLYAGYSDLFRKGDRLIINPDNVFVVPEYGNIDVLMVYDLARAEPRLLASKVDAGANAYGIALSPDGKRVSYLSHVGYPKYSGNVPAWDAFDLAKRPVSYATKDNRGDCRRLAFHPTLPLAATPAEGGALCFDRDGGQLQKDRLDLRLADLASTTVHDLAFAPDGRNLILVCEEFGDWTLRRVPVALSKEEAAKAASGPPAPPPPPAPPAPPATPRQRV